MVLHRGQVPHLPNALDRILTLLSGSVPLRRSGPLELLLLSTPALLRLPHCAPMTLRDSSYAHVVMVRVIVRIQDELDLVV